MLCGACQTVFQGSNPPSSYFSERDSSVAAYEHHPSPALLHKSAIGGCHICLVIWRKLGPDERAALSNTWSNPYLHHLSQAYGRLWGVPVAHYSWSPIWFSKEDFGIRFQFGDEPFWQKIVFRLLPAHNQLGVPLEMSEPIVNGVTDAPKGSAESIRRPSEQIDDVVDMPMWTPRVQRLVQGWYETCTESHDYCRIKDIGHIDEDKHLHANFQPTRILDVSDGKIRLDTDPDNRTEQRYASLTHRWALDPTVMPRLNDENMEAWRNDIDINLLTATFRDAVRVVRKLGIRYIWIDSLCIQQTGPGSKLDWEHESAMMGEIYRHAFLNIQAGRDAEHWNYGLFTTPDSREIDPFQVTISRTLLKPKLRIHNQHPSIPINGTYSIVEEDYARDELLGSPINRRGWVLQERLLSHRIIHFGSQIFWECRHLLACETFPEGLPKTIPKTMARAATQLTKAPTFDSHATTLTHTTSLATHIKRKLPTLPTPSPNIPLPSFPSLTVHRDLFAWFYLAELYSACSLTRETDKLIAISGLAQIFGSPTFHQKASDVVAYLRTLALPRSGGAVTSLNLDSNDISHITSHHAHIGSRPKGDYLAGLWRYELIPCLLWHVANGRQVDGTPSRRIDDDRYQQRAPSWSWASVNGLLNASIYQNWSQGISGTILAEIEYAATTAVYETNPWGQVSGGAVRLWGKVIHEKDLRWPGRDEVEELRHGVRAHMSEVKVGMVRKIKKNSASVARMRILRAEVVCYMDDMEEFMKCIRHSGGGFEVVLLPLVGLQRRRGDWGKVEGYTDEVFEWHGLVLKLRTRSASASVVDLNRLVAGEGMVGTAERLGYFRVRDTEVFGVVLERGEDREITII